MDLHKKKMPIKNFTSPTISAAIRAASVPKKMILMERNENGDVVEETGVVRSSSFGKVVKFSVESADDNVSKPYDPVKNYLSPRPKFLRYNPNRRRKMLDVKENDVDGVDSGTRNGSGPIKDNVISNLKDNDEVSVKNSSSFDARSVLEPVENVTRKEGEGESEDDGDETEEEEEEETFESGEEQTFESGEDGWWSLKGLLKWLVVVITLVLMTRGICSMNSPTDSYALEMVMVKDRSYVYKAAYVIYSRIGSGPITDVDLLMQRFKKLDINHDIDEIDRVETFVGSVEGEHGLVDDGVHHDSVHDETEVIEDEMLSEQENTDHLQLRAILLEQEYAATEVIGTHNLDSSQDNVQQLDIVNDETDVVQDEIWSREEDSGHLQLIEVLQELEITEGEVTATGNVVVKKEVHDQLLTAEDVVNSQLIGVLQEHEIAASEVIEDDNVEVKKVHEQLLTADGDIKTIGVLKSASFESIVAVLIGLILLLLTFVGTIYHSKRTKSMAPATKPVQEEDLKEAEPSANPASFAHHPLKEDVSKEISHIHTPSVEISHIRAPSIELLGEFVFGEEVTSSVRNYNITAEANASNSLIQTATVSFSQTKTSHMEVSTGDSHTTKKPRRKNTESSSMVTPSPVRRSSRLQSRSAMSP